MLILQVKANFNFQKKYTINNLTPTSYNKRFLYAAVGADGGINDGEMLKESSFFDEILNGRAIPDQKVNLSDYENIRDPLTMLFQQDALQCEDCVWKHVRKAKGGQEFERGGDTTLFN